MLYVLRTRGRYLAERPPERTKVPTDGRVTRRNEVHDTCLVVGCFYGQKGRRQREILGYELESKTCGIFVRYVNSLSVRFL